MNNCVGFPNGTVANSYTTQTNTSSAFTSTTARPGLIAIYANNNDRLYFTNSGGIACNIQIPASLIYSGTTLAMLFSNESFICNSASRKQLQYNCCI